MSSESVNQRRTDNTMAKRFERNTAFDRNDALRIVLGHGTVRIQK
jgi:hypothetical protein